MEEVRHPAVGVVRQVIAQSAAQLFTERGYAGTTLDDVAAAAGVTKPLLYRHFESKQALHLELLESHRDGLLGELAETVATPGPLAERLPRIVNAWFAWVESRPYAWRMLFRDTTGVPHIADFHRELQASARSLNVALIRGEPEMDVPSDQVEPLAEAIRSLTTGLALWWLDHPEVPRETLVAVVTRIVRGLVEP